jgi:hypothetical protein
MKTLKEFKYFFGILLVKTNAIIEIVSIRYLQFGLSSLPLFFVINSLNEIFIRGGLPAWRYLMELENKNITSEQLMAVKQDRVLSYLYSACENISCSSLSSSISNTFFIMRIKLKIWVVK